MRQFVTSSIDDIRNGDIIHWRNGFGDAESATVILSKRNVKRVHLGVSQYVPVQHLLNLHRVLKVDRTISNGGAQ